MKGLIIFIAVCTLTAAMVPMDRRTPESSDASTTTTVPSIQICAPDTPCSWSVYDSYTKQIQTNIENEYCKCNNEEVCVNIEDDTAANAYIHKCRVQEAAES